MKAPNNKEALNKFLRLLRAFYCSKRLELVPHDSHSGWHPVSCNPTGHCCPEFPLHQPCRPHAGHNLTEAQLYASRAVDRDWYLDMISAVRQPAMARGYRLRMERHRSVFPQSTVESRRDENFCGCHHLDVVRTRKIAAHWDIVRPVLYLSVALPC